MVKRGKTHVPIHNKVGFILFYTIMAILVKTGGFGLSVNELKSQFKGEEEAQSPRFQYSIQ